MKRFSILLLAIGMAATCFGQNDPLSLSQGRAFQGGVTPTYSSGGFKVLVKNNTTSRVEMTNYTFVDDTVNGHFLIKGNGTTGHGIDLVTPTYKAFAYGMMNSKGSGRFRVQDTANTSKYMELDAHDGITSKDTVFLNQKHMSVRTATGNVALTSDTVQTTINSGKLRIGNATAPLILTGSGTPLGVISAPVGSIYLRTNGVPDSTLYIKSSGTGNTGWYPLMTN